MPTAAEPDPLSEELKEAHLRYWLETFVAPEIARRVAAGEWPEDASVRGVTPLTEIPHPRSPKVPTP